MNPRRQKLLAINKTLCASVESGLNASLTPDDCRELLRIFTFLNSRPPPNPKNAPLNRIVEGVTELAKGVLDDLVDDIIPPRRNR